MKYFYKLFITLTLLLSILFLFVFTIDPYDKLNINPWSLKFKGVFDHRTSKFTYINKQAAHYDAFILGSSRAMQLQPEIVKNSTGFNTFNYSIFTAMPEDYLAICKHLLQIHKPKLIWLQIDFYSLNENMPNTQAFYNSPLSSLVNYDIKEIKNFTIPYKYFSIQAFKDAFKVLKKNIKNDIPRSFKISGESYDATSTLTTVPLLEEYWQHEYQNYKFSYKRLNYLKQLSALCKENQVVLLVSISPMHQKHYDRITNNKRLFSQYLNFENELCKCFDSYTNFNTEHTRMLTTPEYWIDSVHMSTKLGSFVTEDMFSKNYKLAKPAKCLPKN